MILIGNSVYAGKTFLSAKIVELLLSANTRRDKPILVMTYKNLALDQFLELCLKFCKPGELVRVGGRHKTSALVDCNLTNLLKHESSFDEKCNQGMLHNLRNECSEALVDLYQCQRPSVKVLSSNLSLRGFLRTLLLPTGSKGEGMQVTDIKCNNIDIESDEMQVKLSKCLQDWMPHQQLLRAVQARLLSMQKKSIWKIAPASQRCTVKQTVFTERNSKKKDSEDLEDEADHQGSEYLLHEIRGKSCKGKWQKNSIRKILPVSQRWIEKPSIVPEKSEKEKDSEDLENEADRRGPNYLLNEIIRESCKGKWQKDSLQKTVRMAKPTMVPGKNEKEEDLDDLENEADSQESEDLLHDIRGDNYKGKWQTDWLVNNFFSLQDVPKRDTFESLSLIDVCT